MWLFATCCTVVVFVLVDSARKKAASGPCVDEDVPIALHDLEQRLVRLGYLTRELQASCDDATRAAILAFQTDHGLVKKGSVDASTEIYLRSLTQDLPPEPWMEPEPPEV